MNSSDVDAYFKNLSDYEYKGPELANQKNEYHIMTDEEFEEYKKEFYVEAFVEKQFGVEIVYYKVIHEESNSLAVSSAISVEEAWQYLRNYYDRPQPEYPLI